MQSIEIAAANESTGISTTGLENRRGGNSTVGSNPTPSANINGLEQNKPRADGACGANESGPLRHKTRHSLLPERSGLLSRQPPSEPL